MDPMNQDARGGHHPLVRVQQHIGAGEHYIGQANADVVLGDLTKLVTSLRDDMMEKFEDVHRDRDAIMNRVDEVQRQIHDDKNAEFDDNRSQISAVDSLDTSTFHRDNMNFRSQSTHQVGYQPDFPSRDSRPHDRCPLLNRNRVYDQFRDDQRSYMQENRGRTNMRSNDMTPTLSAGNIPNNPVDYRFPNHRVDRMDYFEYPSDRQQRSYRFHEDANVRVKNFNTKDTDWIDYKTYFEKIAIKAKWSDDTMCVKMLGALDNTLMGSTNELPNNFTYSELVGKLDHVNGSEFARREAQNQLNSMKRTGGEPVVKFAERCRQTVNRAFPYYIDRARDEQALWAFLEGLNNDNDFRVSMKSMQFNTLQEAVSYGSNLDHVLKEEKSSKRQHNQYMSRATDVQTSDVESDGEDPDLEMIRKSFDKVGKQFHKVEKKLNSSQYKNKFEHNDYSKDKSNGFPKPKLTCSNCGHDVNLPYEYKTRQNSLSHICLEMGHWANECPMKESSSEKTEKALN